MQKLFLILTMVLCQNYVFGQDITPQYFDVSFNKNIIIQNDTALTNLFSTKKIIAIGEATHGSKEFVYLRQSLFKYLNANNQTDVILLEFPQSVAFWLNDYINNKISLEQIDIICKKAKPYYSKEFFNFLNEIKEINRQKNIYIGGFDIDQYYYLTTNRLLHILSKYDKQYEQKVSNSLQLNVFTDTLLKYISNYDNKEIKNLISSVTNYLNSVKNVFTKNDYFEIEQCLNQYSNTYNYWELNNLKRPYYRDKVMAETIANLSNSFDKSKLLIWAHNNHIRNNDNGNKRLGEWLKEKYAENYLSIGTVFSEGSYRVWFNGKLSIKYLERKNCGSFATYFDNFKRSYFLIHSKDLPEKIKAIKHQIHDVGILQVYEKDNANKYTLKPARDFDMYIYIDKITSYDL